MNEIDWHIDVTIDATKKVTRTSRLASSKQNCHNEELRVVAT